MVSEDKIDGGTLGEREGNECVREKKTVRERRERERGRDIGEREIVEEMEMRVCERESEREREFSRYSLF